MIRINISFLCPVLFILLCFFTACKYKNTSGLKDTDPSINREVLNSAKATVNLWLANDIEGIQFLKNSNWKIDNRVFLNSSSDKGYLLLLNQDKDIDAELDYVQMLYAAKENGKWAIYLASLPNLIIPRKKDHGICKVNSLAELAEAGEKEINSSYKNGSGEINDDLIAQEYTPDLKRNHRLFLAKKIKK